MKLLVKFNLILLVIFGVGGLLIAHFAYSFLVGNARRETLADAQLMMASAMAVRDYTTQDLSPLLVQNPQHRLKFIAETVPAFGATTTFKMLSRQYPFYTYREAALNPTNPNDLATTWEVDVIQELRTHPDKTEVINEHDTDSGRELYIAHPIKPQASCLQCHSTPEAAPRAMLNVYGPGHGFGWKEHEVVGAQIISVPMSVPIQIADKAFHDVVLSLVLALLVTIAALDGAVYFFVLRPLKLVSAHADRISRGEKDVPPLAVQGKDEVAMVTAAFNRMQMSLAKALKMLEE